MSTTNQNPEVVGLDVSQELMTLAPGISPLLARYLENGSRVNPAEQTKHEWFNDVILPKSFSVASITGSDITFAGSVAPLANYILRFKTTSGVDANATVKVTSVAGQVATVTAVSGNISNIAANQIADVISEGIPEGRKYEKGTFHKGPRAYNFTEIFDEGYEISGTLAAIKGNADINSESTQATASLKRLAQKMTKAVTYGVRYETGEVRGLGGIDYFLTQSGANTLAVTGTPTASDVDTLIQTILEKTGEAGELTLTLNGKWAPVIRAWNNRTMGVQETTAGGTVKEYISAIGITLPVIFDNTKPQNKIYIEDMSRIALIPLANRVARFEEKRKDRDGTYVPLTGEYTLEVRNATEAHGAIIIS